jgi:predicted GIY-YIG superfamily endonuclease
VSAYLYMLRCADGSYYVGTMRSSLDERIGEHQTGAVDGYTTRRRPVTLVFHQHFERIEDAIAAERQIKGWRREKKETLIRGDFAALPDLSRRSKRPRAGPSRRAFGAPQDGVFVDDVEKTSSARRGGPGACFETRSAGALLSMREGFMALRKTLVLRRPPTGPRYARPEDRLRGRLEGHTALIQHILLPQSGRARRD